jgi:hypothetical protein
MHESKVYDKVGECIPSLQVAHKNLSSRRACLTLTHTAEFMQWQALHVN